MFVCVRQSLLDDDSHVVRSLVAFGLCKICAVYWSYIPADVIKTLLTSLVQKHAWDSSNTQVRLSVVNVCAFSYHVILSVFVFIVKEYSSEYSDSAFKVEDTIVSRR